MLDIINHAKATSSNAPTENAFDKIKFNEKFITKLFLTKESIIPHSPVFIGDKIQYVIKVKNIGINPALNVVVTDDAPNHVVFTGAATTIGVITTLTPALVVATIGTLNPGQTATVIINGTIV